MIWIKQTFRSGSSSEFREVGRETGFLDSDDHSTGIVYQQGYIGFAVNENLPDEAIENGIADALADQLGVGNPVFGFDEDADHPDFDSKSEELDAYYNGTHPDQR